MEKKFNFVFITTNLFNKHQYVGEHSTNDMNYKGTLSYLGSGRLFLKKVKQYGKENFIREILEFFPTKQEAFDAQEKYIKLYKTHVSQGGYNKDWTGGWCVTQECSIETKQKQSKSRKGKITWMKGKHHSKEAKLKLHEANKNQIPWNKGKKMKNPSWNKGLKMSKEFCNKISKSHTGKKHSLEQNKNHSKKMKGKIPWNKGKEKCFNRETLNKLSESHKGKPGGMKGKKQKLESIEKIRNSRIGKSSGMKGKIPWNKGKKH